MDLIQETIKAAVFCALFTERRIMCRKVLRVPWRKRAKDLK